MAEDKDFAVGFFGLYTDGSDFTCYDNIELFAITCQKRFPDLSIKYELEKPEEE